MLRVSYYLLDACINIIKKFNKSAKYIVLENPIGAMIAISRKYGFDEDFTYDITLKPEIIVDDYSITFFPR